MLSRIFIILFILFADQLSKWWVIETWYKPALDIENTGFLSWLFQAGERIYHPPIEVLPFFNMVMVWNEGVSFGLFNQGGAAAVWILSIIALAVSTIFFVWMIRTPSRFLQIALAFVIGGAIGNVWDRLRFGAVADFFDFHILAYHWPAFNIADAAISIGVVLFLIEAFIINPAHEGQ